TFSYPPSLIEQILMTGELRVVTRNSPTTYYIGADGPVGVEYELAQRFADELGVKLVLRTAGTVGSVFPPLLAGEAHIAAAGLTVTDARREVVAFGPPYQEAVQQLVYRYGSGRPRNPSDLAGDRLEVVAASSHA